MKDLAKKTYDVIVIGAGASGLMCAIVAGMRGKSVLVLEGASRVGQKILISGGGRCNFTNLNVGPENYVGEQYNFCKAALKEFAPECFIKWVKESKINFYEKDKGQLFCESSSKQILNMLLNKIDKLNVTIKTEQKVMGAKKESELFVVNVKGNKYNAKNVVVATGGLSYSNLGASDIGFKIAKEFNHKIIKTNPALVALRWPAEDEKVFAGLAGNSLPVRIVYKKKVIEDDLLFTHFGFSGPAILNASLLWDGTSSLTIDFLPQIKDFKAWFDDKRKTDPKKKMFSVLQKLFSKNMVLVFCKKANIVDRKVAEVSKKDVLRLEKVFKEFIFKPSSTMGYGVAEVTRGGVDTLLVNPKTMESKQVKGLFFTGEVLDVTGFVGGYNLQWAWSSGWVAGKAVS